MKILKSINAFEKDLAKLKKSGNQIGFVPTMGALHDGHLSLIRAGKKRADITVCSIFVNPTQFNNNADLSNYPITLEEDIFQLEKEGCDILLLPNEKDIYPTEASKNQHYDLGNLETILEGAFRPGHFQGVCMVVDILIQLVQPDFLFLGEKDFQQVKVIEKLIALKNYPTIIATVPTMRESSGLAMSSRNKRLSDSEKIIATKLHESLAAIKSDLQKGIPFPTLKNQEITRLHESGIRVEYLEIASRNNLELDNDIRHNAPQLLLIAAYVGSIRLIDNLFI